MRFAVAAMAAMLVVNTTIQADTPSPVTRVCIPYHSSNAQLLDALYKDCSSKDLIQPGFEAFSDPLALVAKPAPFEIVLSNRVLTDKERVFIERRSESKLITSEIGQRRLILVVSTRSSMQTIEVEELKRILYSTDAKGTYTTFVENSPAVSEILAHVFPREKDAILQAGAQRVPFSPRVTLSGRHGVLEAVTKSESAIGIILQRFDQPGELAVMRVLDIKSDGKTFATPKNPVRDPSYPLGESLMLFSLSELPPSGKEFIKFATGSQSSELRVKHGFVTQTLESKFLAERRLQEAKAGKGTQVFVRGESKLGMFVQSSASEYVSAKALLQTSFQATQLDLEAIASFVDPARNAQELLFLTGRADEQRLRQFAKQWSELNPREFASASTVVGIVAHPTSKLSSVTLDQVKGLLSGQLDDWKALGGTPGKTFLYTLPAPVEASKYIVKEMLGEAGKLRTDAKQRKDTADVISAVSLDPQGIGIVDLSAIPDLGADIKGVKVLGIGPAMRPVSPSIEAIRTGAYPLAQPLYLYVHPKASETAKDFAAFIVSGECDETFRKNGLIPLSEKAVKASVIKPAATEPAKSRIPEKAGATK